MAIRTARRPLPYALAWLRRCRFTDQLVWRLVASRAQHGTWATGESDWDLLILEFLHRLLGRTYSPELVT